MYYSSLAIGVAACGGFGVDYSSLAIMASREPADGGIVVAWQAAEAVAAVEVSASIGSVTAGGASDATMGGVGADNASCSRLSLSGTPMLLQGA